MSKREQKGSASFVFGVTFLNASPPRIQLDGVPLHIVQRGHNREACFYGEQDYQACLHWLGEALGESNCRLHAYALMTNHVHLLLTPKKAALVPRLIAKGVSVNCLADQPQRWKQLTLTPFISKIIK